MVPFFQCMLKENNLQEKEQIQAMNIMLVWIQKCKITILQFLWDHLGTVLTFYYKKAEVTIFSVYLHRKNNVL